MDRYFCDGLTVSTRRLFEATHGDQKAQHPDGPGNLSRILTLSLDCRAARHLKRSDALTTL